MGKRKSQLNTYWILGIGAVLLVLVLALWVWPTYFTDSQPLNDTGISSVQLPSSVTSQQILSQSPHVVGHIPETA